LRAQKLRFFAIKIVQVKVFGIDQQFGVILKIGGSPGL